MSGYVTLLDRGEHEYTDRRSVFTGFAAPVSTEEAALAFISSVRRDYPDARHHVYAYVLRDRSLMRFSDDGEPQGTAGMPVLDVIRKRGIVDAAVVVVRYFGGILLGTGGLVRAYTEAAAGAVTAAHPVTYDLYDSIAIETAYSDYQKLQPLLPGLGFSEVSTDFSDRVTLYGTVSAAEYAALCTAVTDRTGARAAITLLEEKFDYRAEK